MRGGVVALSFLLLVAATVPTAAPQVAPEHTPRPPIQIDGNDDLTAANGVTRGSGTPDDPYVIEGWLIAGATHLAAPIHLRDVSEHVLIRQNLLSIPLGWAIRVEQSSNITIHENEVRASNSGFHIHHSQGILVEGNQIIGHPSRGLVWAVSGIVVVGDSHEVIIRGNVVEGYGQGISVQRGPSSILIEHNTVKGGEPWGAIEANGANQVDILHNDISVGKIQIIGSSGSRIEANTVHGNGISTGFGSKHIRVANNTISGAERGLDILCGECEVAGNLVSDSASYGALSGDEGPLLVHNNTFVGHDEGFSGTWHGVTAHRNNFIDPPMVVIEVASHSIDFRYNWWGDPSGPAEGMIPERVAYDPWLIEPSPGAPSA